MPRVFPERYRCTMPTAGAGISAVPEPARSPANVWEADMLKLIRPLALFIMVAAMASSYHTQLVLFRTWKVDSFTAVIAPFAVDALAVICSIAIGAKGASGKPLAATVLVVTLGGSMTANFIAGATLGSRIVHAGMVLIYLMAELVASKVRAAEAGAEVVVAVAAQEAAVVQPTTPEPAKVEELQVEVPVTAPKPRRKAAGRYHPVETVSASA